MSRAPTLLARRGVVAIVPPPTLVEVISSFPDLLSIWSFQEPAAPIIDLIGSQDLTQNNYYDGDFGEYGDPDYAHPLSVTPSNPNAKSLQFSPVSRNNCLESGGTPPDFSGSAPYTVGLFMQLDAVTEPGCFVQQSYPPGPLTYGNQWQWELAARVDGTGIYIAHSRYDAGASGETVGSPYVSIDTPYLVEAVMDGTNFSLRVNGAQVDSAASIRGLSTYGSPIVFGRTQAGGAQSGSSIKGACVAYGYMFDRAIDLDESLQIADIAGVA